MFFNENEVGKYNLLSGPWMHVEPWIHGTTSWIHELMGGWAHVSMTSWVHGSMDPLMRNQWLQCIAYCTRNICALWCMGPCEHERMEPWIHSRIHGFMGACGRGSMISWIHVPMAPWIVNSGTPRITYLYWFQVVQNICAHSRFIYVWIYFL